MACPYFFPTGSSAEIPIPARARLPLGAACCGSCSVTHSEPDLVTLGEQCNLGYAAGCNALPQDRTADAVRFHVLGDAQFLRVVCVFERDHRPAGTAELSLNLSTGIWTRPHPDPVLHRQAEIYVANYLARLGRPLPHAPTQS